MLRSHPGTNLHHGQILFVVVIARLLHGSLQNRHIMTWPQVLAFVLGYLVTPALAVGAAALLIHLILLIQNYRLQRAIRADSLIPIV